MRTRRWLGRLSLVLLSTFATLAALDWRLRGEVGECGLTPFRTATVKGLPHELFPGRTTLYKGVEVRINSIGLRGEELPAPQPDRRRIAIVGDSVTFGNGCPEDDTVPRTLAAELLRRGQPCELVNCGIPAYNADNVATMVRERVVALAPQQVIWVMVANDVCDAHRRTEIPVDATIDAFADFPLGSPLLQLLNVQASGILRALGLTLDGYVESVLRQHERTGIERLRRALTEMKSQCAAAGIDFRVAIYPFMTRQDRNPFRPIEDSCAALCGEMAIPCLRLSDAFAPDANLGAYWVALLDAHPDGVANRRVAEFLAESWFKP
ncbi:MAG: SGNH/GDSL hydrolase family protein [Planctomycetes bacterium]|nr:SGNH/GDSL hydrolase family protein [Planctomycetota bacterium]